jgi:hypothetical protein
MDTRGPAFYDMIDYYGKNKGMPGKGMYVLDEITNADKLIHNYQVLYRFSNKPNK